MLMVSRAVITIIDDSAKIQRAQVKLLDSEVAELERYQDYGATSRPPAGSEAIAIFVGGSRDHGVVIRVDNREYRLKLPHPGDVAVYDSAGDKIVLTPSAGRVEVTAVSEVVVKAPKAIVESGDISLGAEALAALGGGVVTVMCSCSVTGAPHPVGSGTVKAAL